MAEVKSGKQFVFTVERSRGSVTQGMAKVFLNGEEVMEFGDNIELIHDGDKYYGQKIGDWASKTPDEAFIKGTLFHPLDSYYKYSEKVREILDREA